ncbi:hypothetical protein K503DRAFT_266773 [Rhizopogon vinicolor AM-OR11-026]|uniref:Uncharacterized protein n=1 Tax=Rhizopogon vinicolor AM-OR11-026 TaxID=1314800 RepID=A0A1B7MWD3_9AGAM|nr:hypothetical protein K503DRAFT_266773 [Rhizopogon vinicolor AM-OR11-026]
MGPVISGLPLKCSSLMPLMTRTLEIWCSNMTVVQKSTCITSCCLPLHSRSMRYSRLGAPRIFALHVPRLRSRRLTRYNIYCATLLRMCTALEEFVLHRVSGGGVLSLAHDISPTIKHSSFRNEHKRRDSLQPIIDAADALPKLRLLACDKNPEQFVGEFEILNARCRTKVLKLFNRI